MQTTLFNPYVIFKKYSVEHLSVSLILKFPWLCGSNYLILLLCITLYLKEQTHTVSQQAEPFIHIRLGVYYQLNREKYSFWDFYQDLYITVRGNFYTPVWANLLNRWGAQYFPLLTMICWKQIIVPVGQRCYKRPGTRPTWVKTDAGVLDRLKNVVTQSDFCVVEFSRGSWEMVHWCV